MNKTKGIILFKNVLDLMQEAEYIEGVFNKFLVRAMEDYCFDNQKIGHALEILFKYDSHLVDEQYVQENVFTDTFIAGRKDFAEHIENNYWENGEIVLTKTQWKDIKEQLEINSSNE